MLTGLLAFITDLNWRTFSLCILLFWQGSLYVAAPVYSLLSLQNIHSLSAQIPDQGKPMLEELAARWVIATCMLLMAAFSLLALLPTPKNLPEYVRFLPVNPSRSPQANPASTPTPNIPPNAPMATVTVESANCRTQPRGGAERVTILYQGQQVAVLGRNADINNPWWYVKIPNSNENCWLWGLTSRLNGKVGDIPIK